jgi:hypothetical protein
MQMGDGLGGLGAGAGGWVDGGLDCGGWFELWLDELVEEGGADE